MLLPYVKKKKSTEIKQRDVRGRHSKKYKEVINNEKSSGNAKWKGKKMSHTTLS